jgi:hypothetical protein
MTSREVEKMQKAKRRLQAITFLTNISLDGSYKDTGWGLEHAKIEAASEYCRDSGNGLNHSCRDGRDRDPEGAFGMLNDDSETRDSSSDYSHSKFSSHHHSRGLSQDGRFFLEPGGSGSSALDTSEFGPGGRRR